jgi:hypothetical protein
MRLTMTPDSLRYGVATLLLLLAGSARAQDSAAQADSERLFDEMADMEAAKQTPPAVLAPTPSADTAPTPASPAPRAAEPAPVVVAAPPAEAEPAEGVAIDVVPYVGTSAIGTGESRHFVLHLIGGVSEGVKGAELATVFNTNLQSLRGIEAAGVFNTLSGSARGAQLAGVFNIGRGELRGFQGAGVFNILRGPMVIGMQASGAFNIAAAGFRGMQASGGFNVAHGPVQGVQAAGGANLAVGDLHGAQLAGGLNMTKGEVHGVQIAPINFAAGEVHGVQIGVINMAENADAALGLVNLMWGGRWDLEAGSTSSRIASLTLRNAARYTHGILSFGATTQESDKERIYSFGYGLGAHLGLGDHLMLEGDTIGRSLVTSPDDRRSVTVSMMATARGTLSLGLGPISLYAGPSYNVLVTRDLAPTGKQVVSGLERRQACTVRSCDHDAVRAYLWPGAEFGVRVRLH